MNGAPAVVATSSRAMVATLALVATLCGILIVSAYQGTLSAVTANKRVALERAVFKVVPGAVSVKEFVAGPAGIAPAGGVPAKDTVKFYAAYDAAGALKGIAAEGSASGYADVVRVLYAWDPARQAITGLGVIAMRETPGIGDKIYTDAAFLANFEALDARLDASGTALANPIRVVKHGSKRNPWEIDAISGATVTSKAVGRGINDSAQRLLPRLAPNLDQLRGN
ncbi:MAG: FMN-binding protein [Gallionellaceae bacterium]|nr:FMN-binding protein [Gallionellaceae bacterium]